MQSDPIGLWDGWETYGYVDSQPLAWGDYFGLAMTVTSTRTGRVVHNDPNYLSPCLPGTSPSAKGKAGETEMLKLVNQGSIPAISGTAVRNTSNNVAPPSGRRGRARTDGVINGGRGRPPIGLEAKCGPCAGPTKHQRQNYKPAVSPNRGTRRQFMDIFIIRFT